MIYESIEDLIGNTPLLKISPKVHGLKNIDLYAKLEYYNPFGSVKDRIAKGMLQSSWQTLQEKGQTVIESSSGNTGKAVAALCSVHGVPFKTITNRIKVPEQRMVMQVLGADIEELPGFSECPDPSDPNNAITLSEKLVATEPAKYLYPNQYVSPLNVQSHEETGREILADLNQVDYYIGFLGTSGSTLGAGRVIREKHPQAKIIGIIAQAHNHIPGGREAQEMWEVGLFEKSFYSEILSGTTQEAIDGMLTLVRQAGILCGPTTGANYSAGLKYLQQEDEQLQGTGERKAAVFIACDRIEPYLSYLKKHRPEIFSSDQDSRPHLSRLDDAAIEAAPRLTAEELWKQNEQESDKPTIVDLRGNFAYQIGHIPGSINIPSDHFDTLIEQGSIFPPGKKVVLACRVGDISQRYTAFLRQQGVECASLAKGILGWREQGRPLQRGTAS